VVSGVQLVDRRIGLVRAEHEIAQRAEEGVERAVLDPVGGLVATGGADGSIEVWDASTGARKASMRTGGRVCRLAFSSDSKLLYSSDEFGGCALWDVPASGEVLGTCATPKSEFRTKHSMPESCCAFSADLLLLATGSGGKDVHVHEVSSGSHKLSVHHGSRVRCLAWVLGSSTLASGGDDGAVKIWGLSGEALVLKMSLKHPERVMCMAISPDSEWIVAGYGHRMQVWGVATGQKAKEHLQWGHTGEVNCVAFSPS